MVVRPGNLSAQPFLALVAALVLLILPAAAGCGGDEGGGGTTTAVASSTSAATTTVATTTTTAATTTTTQAATTTTRAPEPFAVGIAIAPGSGDAVEVPVLAAAERVSAEYPAEVAIAGSDDLAADLRELAAAADLVVAVGFGYDEPLAEVAPEFPGVVFVRLEGSVNAPNVTSASFAMNEAAFLVGAAAALTTETGKVAFLGGMPIDSVTRLEAGFKAGVTAADPGVEVSAEYLAEVGDWAVFSDPERARVAAQDLYAAGVDVIFQGAGSSGIGVFQAAAGMVADHKLWAIGVDVDQAVTAGADLAPVVLTSAMSDYEAAVLWAAAEFAAGALTGGEVDLGVAEGAVGYATTGGWLEPIADQLDALAAGIADGSIEVPEQP